MSDTITLCACVLDMLNMESLIPEKIIVTPERIEIEFNFDTLSPQERITIKKMMRPEKFIKSAFTNSIYCVKRSFGFGSFEGVPQMVALRVDINSAYECKQICTPKHHPVAEEDIFLKSEESE